jgi:glycosyltransferase involved in cell wall biosynthesis
MAKFLFYDDKIINLMVREEKPTGGAAVQAYGWIRGLTEVGHDVQVITNVKQNEVLKDECSDIRLIPLYDQKKGVRWLRWVYYRLPYIYRKIKQTKPDYLYQGIPGWQSFLIGVICYKLDIKYVLRISNDYLLDNRFYKNNSRTHRFFQKMGIELSYCILCQNDYQFNIIRKEYPDKMAIKIPNPIFINKKVDIDDIQSKQYIAWLGLYQYQKNLKLLYEIACLQSNEQFLIAGKEGTTCDQETLNYLEQLKQLPNVKFIGFLHRDQVLPFLSKAKFLLNTSHYEGFSNTFLEAMAVGTPIITSNKVNPDEIITRFNLGIVYENTSDLNRQYSSITPELYKKMSNNAHNYVVNQHDYRTLSKRLMSFLSNN